MWRDQQDRDNISIMALRNIVTMPDHRLTSPCRPVSAMDGRVARLCADLHDTLDATQNGIGLAAPQIGTSLRIIAIDRNLGQGKSDNIILINPRIIKHDTQRITGEEGCLSIPGYYAPVARYRTVTLEYIDQDESTHSLEAEDFLAVCIQHECDHLDGVLFIDYLSPLKRSMALRRTRKWQREHTYSDSGSGHHDSGHHESEYHDSGHHGSGHHGSGHHGS